MSVSFIFLLYFTTLVCAMEKESEKAAVIPFCFWNRLTDKNHLCGIIFGYLRNDPKTVLEVHFVNKHYYRHFLKKVTQLNTELFADVQRLNQTHEFLSVFYEGDATLTVFARNFGLLSRCWWRHSERMVPHEIIRTSATTDGIIQALQFYEKWFHCAPVIALRNRDRTERDLITLLRRFLPQLTTGTRQSIDQGLIISLQTDRRYAPSSGNTYNLKTGQLYCHHGPEHVVADFYMNLPLVFFVSFIHKSKSTQFARFCWWLMPLSADIKYVTKTNTVHFKWDCYYNNNYGVETEIRYDVNTKTYSVQSMKVHGTTKDPQKVHLRYFLCLQSSSNL